MPLLFLLASWGIVGAGVVSLIKIVRCPCPWPKLLVAFLGGALGGWLFQVFSKIKIVTSMDFAGSCFPAIALAALFYCIVCPLGPPPPPIRE